MYILVHVYHVYMTIYDRFPKKPGLPTPIPLEYIQFIHTIWWSIHGDYLIYQLISVISSRLTYICKWWRIEYWLHWWSPTQRQLFFCLPHYDDVIMGAMASQITRLTIVYSAVYSGAVQSKHQSSAPLAFVWGIHRGPVNSPHKWPVTRKCFHLMTSSCENKCPCRNTAYHIRYTHRSIVLCCVWL